MLALIPTALVADARSQWRNALRFSAPRRCESQRQGRMVLVRQQRVARY